MSLSSFYLLPQRSLWWDKDLSMLNVLQRTQNSPLPDKMMVETRGWRERKGLIWCKDLLPGSRMCLGFSLGPHILLCKIHSEWIAKYINFPICALVILILRPSHDLRLDKAFQEWIFIDVHCYNLLYHLLLMQPHAPCSHRTCNYLKKCRRRIIFSCTEGVGIQGGMP